MSEIFSPASKAMDGVYSETLDGLLLKSGDIICTTSGLPEILIGEFWRILGRLVPGEVDHVIVYAGPDGLCVEAGPWGVNAFHFTAGTWDAQVMLQQRGLYVDQLVGIAYPLVGQELDEKHENLIRQMVRSFCLEQVRLGKPYNMNFLDPHTSEAFYCSQLPYQAYLLHGIDLNTGLGMPDLPGSERIVFPQEIWAGCFHQSTGQMGEP